jgi:hypothetical protein
MIQVSCRKMLPTHNKKRSLGAIDTHIDNLCMNRISLDYQYDE